jgi:predicted O-methyltransferase YrrM
LPGGGKIANLFRGGDKLDNFSLNTALLKDILESAKPLGHNEKPDNLNLGFGFLYYGLARALRPKHLLVIGSGFGFSVVCFALGIKDNGGGMLTFVDPSYSLIKNGPFKTIGGKDKWSEPLRVHEHFKQFGVEDMVTHYKLRSDQFFSSFKALGLPPIDIAFIDGSHAYENVRNDFLNILEHVHKNSYILLHDSNIYVREIIGHAGVKKWLKTIRKEKEFFEIANFPFSSGMALVHILQDKVWRYAK